MVKDPLSSAIVRHYVRSLEKDEHALAKDILVDNKILPPGGKTVLLDQFTGAKETDLVSMGGASNVPGR